MCVAKVGSRSWWMWKPTETWQHKKTHTEPQQQQQQQPQ